MRVTYSFFLALIASIATLVRGNALVRDCCNTYVDVEEVARCVYFVVKPDEDVFECSNECCVVNAHSRPVFIGASENYTGGLRVVVQNSPDVTFAVFLSVRGSIDLILRNLPSLEYLYLESKGDVTLHVDLSNSKRFAQSRPNCVHNTFFAIDEIDRECHPDSPSVPQRRSPCRVAVRECEHHVTHFDGRCWTRNETFHRVEVDSGVPYDDLDCVFDANSLISIDTIVIHNHRTEMNDFVIPRRIRGVRNVVVMNHLDGVESAIRVVGLEPGSYNLRVENVVERRRVLVSASVETKRKQTAIVLGISAYWCTLSAIVTCTGLLHTTVDWFVRDVLKALKSDTRYELSRAFFVKLGYLFVLETVGFLIMLIVIVA